MAFASRKRVLDDNRTCAPSKTLRMPLTRQCIPDFQSTMYYNNDSRLVGLGTWELNRAKGGTHTELGSTEQARRDLEDVENHCQQLLQLDTVPLAISVDTIAVHRAFATLPLCGGLKRPPPFPLVSDHTRLLSHALGVIDERTHNSRRAVFVVNNQREILRGQILHDDAPLPWETIIRVITRAL